MKLVVDTSVLLAVCTNEASKPRLIELTAGRGLVAPGSVHWEVGNALSAMLKRQRITLAQAQACMSEYQKIPIRLVPVDVAQALVLSDRFRMYAYDAYLLSCALQANMPLITLDGPLKIAATQLGVAVLET
jgi:predicted nucleic acid-binding protein